MVRVTEPKDMQFSREPTARGDDEAAYVREWYEANRETWWDRLWHRWDYVAAIRALADKEG